VFGNGGEFQGSTLAQRLATVTGRMYSFDFDAGIAGTRSGNPLQLRVQVFGSGALLDSTVTPPEAGTVDPTKVKFDHYHFVFTANSVSTKLQLTDIGSSNDGADQLLHNVMMGRAEPVQEATPTPT